jgi:hypothetical protein
MTYIYSHLTFISYFLIINIYEMYIIFINKYKELYQYIIIYEDSTDYNNYDFEPLYIGLVLLPIYIQDIIMLYYILNTFYQIYDLYLQIKNTNLIIIKTYKSIFGIFISINTIINSFYEYNHIFLTTVNIISIYLMLNNYSSKICNSFFNS